VATLSAEDIPADSLFLCFTVSDLPNRPIKRSGSADGETAMTLNVERSISRIPYRCGAVSVPNFVRY
jgi:hypothetical protein